MTNRTLSCYEVAWNMHRTGSHINQICQVVDRDRATIYRWLHSGFTKAAVGVKRYKKHQALVVATKPREVVEHDTVDLGGGVYAHTAIDIFTKEPSVYIATDLTMATGATAFAHHDAFYGHIDLQQSDNGSEFQTTFREAVEASGSKHRYSRPYKKNEQSHIENFNKSLMSECFPGSEYNPKDIPKLQEQANTYTRHYIHRRWHKGLPDTMCQLSSSSTTPRTQNLLQWN